MDPTKPICIIPARGGSKRIPRKNIIDFAGKPMIVWTIEAAQKADLFADILVSTDDEEIAHVAKKAGASVPFLRRDKNDDYSTISEATIATLAQLKEFSGQQYEVVVQLMANCPLRDENDIRRSYENFISRGLTHQISCFQFGWMNPWWACRLDDEDRPQSIFPDDPRKQRSQDLPPLHCATGAIWIAKVRDLFESNSFFGPDLRYCPLDWISAVDIDDENDLQFALAAAQVKQ